jgi:hypothetical protein
MKDLYLIINKLKSFKGIKDIYYDLGIPEDITVDKENIKDIISKSNTFIDRVILLTALLDEDIDTKIMLVAYKDNIEAYDFIKKVSSIDNKKLTRIEESEDGWSYTIDDSPYETTVKSAFEKAKKEFETKK